MTPQRSLRWAQQQVNALAPADPAPQARRHLERASSRKEQGAVRGLKDALRHLDDERLIVVQNDQQAKIRRLLVHRVRDEAALVPGLDRLVEDAKSNMEAVLSKTCATRPCWSSRTHQPFLNRTIVQALTGTTWSSSIAPEAPMTNSPMILKAREFLSLKRVAIVGVSRAEKDMSRAILRELLARGYDVVPVSPVLEGAEGRPCFRRVQDIQPPVEAALLMTPRTQTDAVVQDCIEASVKMVWMHRGTGPGSATASAVVTCQKHGIGLITDLCPFMVLPNASWPHRLHGFFRRRTLWA